MLVCTGKDLVKLSADHWGDPPLWAVGIEIEFLSGRQSLESRLQRLLSGVGTVWISVTVAPKMVVKR